MGERARWLSQYTPFLKRSANVTQIHDRTFLMQALLVKQNVCFLIRLHRNWKKADAGTTPRGQVMF